MIFNWTDSHPPIEKSRDDRSLMDIDTYTRVFGYNVARYMIRVIHIFWTRYFRDRNVIFLQEDRMCSFNLSKKKNLSCDLFNFSQELFRKMAIYFAPFNSIFANDYVLVRNVLNFFIYCMFIYRYRDIYKYSTNFFIFFKQFIILIKNRKGLGNIVYHFLYKINGLILVDF